MLDHQSYPANVPENKLGEVLRLILERPVYVQHGTTQGCSVLSPSCS
jgi:hypothetical protein